jgi:hypothetical protein
MGPLRWPTWVLYHRRRAGDAHTTLLFRSLRLPAPPCASLRLPHAATSSAPRKSAVMHDSVTSDASGFGAASTATLLWAERLAER